MLAVSNPTPRFNSCRVPGQTEDRVRVYPAAGNHHVLVIRRNRFFVIHATNAEGEVRSLRDIESQLQAVVDLAGSSENEARPVGALTAWGRAEWASAREQLVADGNEELLERAEAAALTVCLDDYAPQTKSDVARALWHGDGRNRHFDKSVQIVVFANGKAGLVGEHSMMDGMPVRRRFRGVGRAAWPVADEAVVPWHRRAFLCVEPIPVDLTVCVAVLALAFAFALAPRCNAWREDAGLRLAGSWFLRKWW